jgi:hypothetical protein
MTTLTIAKRFCGPPASANGGYFSGLVAGLSGRVVTVRLMKPPPLEVALDVVHLDGDLIELRRGDMRVAQARPGSLAIVPPLEPPLVPSYEEALEASRHYAGFTDHPFPTCFVCGTQRARGDGLRIFAGPLARAPALVASPWTPDASLDRGDGKVRPEFMSAAMDCPGCFAITQSGRGMMLLGEFTAHVDRCVHVDEPCTVLGWHISSNGRKHEAGTALYDEDGELCARAKALWIEPASTT